MNPTAEQHRQAVWNRAGNFLTEFMDGAATADLVEHGVDDAAQLGLTQEPGEEARAYAAFTWTQFSLDDGGVADIRDSDHISDEDLITIESGRLRVTLLSEPFDALETIDEAEHEDEPATE